MKFSTREDVEAPIATVFGMLSEFEVYERSAIRRGADVNRVGDHDVPHEGQTWNAGFRLRGKDREARIDSDELIPQLRLHRPPERADEQRRAR